MELSFRFGTFDVPAISDSLTANFIAPGIIVMDEWVINENPSNSEKLSEFNKKLKKGLDYNPKDKK